MSCYVFVLGLIVFCLLGCSLFVVFLLGLLCVFIGVLVWVLWWLNFFLWVVYVGGVLSLRVAWYLFEVVTCL